MVYHHLQPVSPSCYSPLSPEVILSLPGNWFQVFESFFYFIFHAIKKCFPNPSLWLSLLCKALWICMTSKSDPSSCCILHRSAQHFAPSARVHVFSCRMRAGLRCRCTCWTGTEIKVIIYRVRLCNESWSLNCNDSRNLVAIDWFMSVWGINLIFR